MKQLIENVMTALDELEVAIDEHDYRKIGGRLYLLRQALKKLLEEVTG